MSNDKGFVTYQRSVPSQTYREDSIETVIKICGNEVGLITTQNGIDIYNDGERNILYGVKDNRVIIKVLARKTRGSEHIDFIPLSGIKKEAEQ